MPNESNDKIISSFKTEFNKIIDIELSSISSIIAMQKYMQNTILSLSDRLWNNINSSSDIDLIHNTSKSLYDISNFSFKLHSNITNLEKLQAKLETLNLTNNNIELNEFFFDNIKQYHQESLTLIDNSLSFNSSFNDFIMNFSGVASLSNNSCSSESTSDNNTNSDNHIKEENIQNEEKQNLYIPDDLKENTLIISNIEVILPFTKKDLQEKYETSGLSSYEEIIDNFYKRSAKSFEHSAISRFKEAYSLIINKEHGSKFQAISLALELSTNYNLHPAIIAACKNLTQLDVYLSCLEYKELSDFRFFDIVYNIPPTPKKNILKKAIASMQNEKELSK